MGRLTVNEGQECRQELMVAGRARFRADVAMDAALSVGGRVSAGSVAAGDVAVSGGLGVGRSMSVGSDASVAGNFFARSNVTVSRILSVEGTADVAGKLHAKQDVEVDRNLKVDGNVQAQGELKDKFGVALPPGTVVAYAGTSVPAGWLLCDGKEHPSGGSNAALARALGSSYSRPRSKFAVPDLRKRFIVGASGTTGAYRPGATGGQERVALNLNEMPSHNHTVNDPGHSHTYSRTKTDSNRNRTKGTGRRTWYYQDATTDTKKTGISVQNRGGSQAHENRPPFYALKYIIKK